MERTLLELKDDMGRFNPGAVSDPPQVKRESLGSSTPIDRTSYQNNNSGPRDVRSMDLNEHSHLTGDDVYLGGGSIPALIKALTTGNNGNRIKFQEVFGDSMLPLFGLDNESATYPFVSLWGYQGAAVRINELRKVLPGETESIEYV